jgi:hypothetical protein
MEGKHWHTGIDHVLFYGLSAIVVINLLYLAGAKLAMTQNPIARKTGLVIGSLVKK